MSSSSSNVIASVAGGIIAAKLAPDPACAMHHPIVHKTSPLPLPHGDVTTVIPPLHPDPVDLVVRYNALPPLLEIATPSVKALAETRAGPTGANLCGIDNQKLEYAGDRALYYFLALHLIEMFPNPCQMILSALGSLVTNNKTLATISKAYKLLARLQPMTAMEKAVADYKTHADAFESHIGALAVECRRAGRQDVLDLFIGQIFNPVVLPQFLLYAEYLHNCHGHTFAHNFGNIPPLSATTLFSYFHYDNIRPLPTRIEKYNAWQSLYQRHGAERTLNGDVRPTGISRHPSGKLAPQGPFLPHLWPSARALRTGPSTSAIAAVAMSTASGLANGARSQQAANGGYNGTQVITTPLVQPSLATLISQAPSIGSRHAIASVPSSHVPLATRPTQVTSSATTAPGVSSSSSTHVSTGIAQSSSTPGVAQPSTGNTVILGGNTKVVTPTHTVPAVSKAPIMSTSYVPRNRSVLPPASHSSGGLQPSQAGAQASSAPSSSTLRGMPLSTGPSVNTIAGQKRTAPTSSGASILPAPKRGPGLPLRPPTT